MARGLRLALLLPGCWSLAEGLHVTTDAQAGEGDDGKVETVTWMPDFQKRKRIVIAAATPDDPFERVMHHDDWLSGLDGHGDFDLGSPVCITEVGTKMQRCNLVSQKLCNQKSTKIPRSDRRFPHELGRCFTPRESCAVVGSSGHLLNVSWGDRIDSHDVVIRINAAPSGAEEPGLADKVGSHTDVRFVNMYGHVPEGMSDNKPLCLFLHEPKMQEKCGHLCWSHPSTCKLNANCTDKASSCGKIGCELNRMRCVGGGMKEADHKWGNHEVFLDNLHAGIADQVVPHSTAGFKAVIYAMSICNHVTVIGFGPTCSGAVGGRYYSDDKRVTKVHHYNEELALLMRADEQGAKAMIPPEARMWLAAKKVTVALPECVDRQSAARLHQVFNRFGTAVNLVSEASFKAF